MKKFITTYAIVWFPILFVLVLTFYFTIIILKYPLVGIELKEKNNQWIVESIYENGWASSQPIEKGDILKLVDGKNPEEHFTVKWFNRAEMTNNITILDKNLNTKIFSISYSDFDSQYIIYLLFPYYLLLRQYF